ncbi:MAG: TolC family outer membrane protein [Magnetococcus sp. YQC-5]
MSRMFRIGMGVIGICWILSGQSVMAGVQEDAFLASIHAALQKNPRANGSALQLKAAQERLPQSKALLYPNIDLNASRSHNRTEWSGGSASTDPLSLGVVLTQSLYNQKAWVGLRQTKPYVASFESDLQGVIQGVFMETASAIVEVLQFKEVLGLAVNNRDRLAQHLDATRTRFKVGEITRTDVSQAQARLATAEAMLVRAENALAVGRSRFQELTGGPVPEGLILPEFKAGFMDAPLPELQRAIQSRPDLMAAKLRSQVAEEEVAMKRAAHMPTVALTARATRSKGDEMYADPVDRYVVDVGVSLPIFAGGMTVSQTSEALARKEAQDAEVDRLTRLATREVESAYLDLQSARAADVALQTALNAAKEALEGVQKEYQVGTRTALDLLDAQNESFSAQTELAKSRFAIVLAQFRLLHTLGRLSLDALILPSSAGNKK